MSDEKREGDELKPGQRRRSTCTNGVLCGPGKELTIDGLHTDGRWKYFYDGDKHPFYRDAAGILMYSVPLGGPTPVTGARPLPAKGQRRRANADAEELCPGEEFVLIEQDGDLWHYRYDDGYGFSRSTDVILAQSIVVNGPALTTAPTAAPKVSCVDCAGDITEKVKAAVVGGGWRCVPCNGKFQARVILAKRAPAPAPKPLYGRMVGEMRAADGTPLSALGMIASRSKPEPWIPSVDEWDLLPSVDERGWRS